MVIKERRKLLKNLNDLLTECWLGVDASKVDNISSNTCLGHHVMVTLNNGSSLSSTYIVCSSLS